jgi:membrane protein
MSFFETIKERIKQLSSKIKPIGFEGLTLLEIFRLFRAGVHSSAMNNRAAAISFKFFMAIFPGVIFFFSILPIVPISDFKNTILVILHDFTPEQIYPAIEHTIFDILSRHQEGLLSIGFLMALYFSSGGFMSVINAFNQSNHINETRSRWQQRVTSVVLVFITGVIILIALLLILAGRKTIAWFISEDFIHNQTGIQIFFYARWLAITAMLFFSVSFIYFLAPAKRTRYRFFSAGSTLTTLLILLIGFGFRFFIMYFSRHNALYGSVGTLMIILLFIYLNAFILLIGFELNAALLKGKTIRKKTEVLHKKHSG